MENLIQDGIHYLSGVGNSMYHDEWNNEDFEVNLFKIDDVVYGAYIDPDDGYRSYGRIDVATKDVLDNMQLYEFPPQKVIVENVHDKGIKTYESCFDECNRRFIIIKDAILNKEVLRVGTDYTDSYYPCAIFNYQPMNLYANVEHSMCSVNNG